MHWFQFYQNLEVKKHFMLSFFVQVLTLQMLKQQKHQHDGSYVVVFVCCGRERTMPPAADMTHCCLKGTPAAKMQSAATTSSIGQRRQVVGNTVFPVLFFYYIGKKICQLPSRITKINIFNPCISIYRSTHAPNSSIYYLKVSNKETTQNLPLKL